MREWKFSHAQISTEKCNGVCFVYRIPYISEIPQNTLVFSALI